MYYENVCISNDVSIFRHIYTSIQQRISIKSFMYFYKYQPNPYAWSKF